MNNTLLTASNSKLSLKDTRPPNQQHIQSQDVYEERKHINNTALRRQSKALLEQSSSHLISVQPKTVKNSLSLNFAFHRAPSTKSIDK